MQIFFAAQRNHDQTEGRGPMVTIGVFSRIEPAYSLIVGQGVMGVGDGNVALVYVYDSVDEMKQHQASFPEKYAYRGWEKKWNPSYRIHDPRLADPDYQKFIEKQRMLADLQAEVSGLEKKFM